MAERVKEGGHPAPEDKIRARFDRNVPLIHEAMRMADIGYVYDNSALNIPHQHLMTFEQGQIVKLSHHQPPWAHRIYKEDIEHFQANKSNREAEDENGREGGTT
ncbi:signal transduction histidine kinase [Nitrospira sp. M1]